MGFGINTQSSQVQPQNSAINASNFQATQNSPGLDKAMRALVDLFERKSTLSQFVSILSTLLSERSGGSQTSGGANSPSSVKDPFRAVTPSTSSSTGTGSMTSAKLTAAIGKYGDTDVKDGVVDGSELRKFMESPEFDSLPKDVQLQAKYIFDKAGINEFHTAGEWAAKILAAKPSEAWKRENG
jgi:hypothetical protein